MKKLGILFAFFFALNTIAQGEANVWYFGHNAGLDFNSGSPVALTDGLIDTFEGCSSFSDINGNLLFYSDGTTVWNKNHVPMTNGTGLAGDSSSSQSAMVIPNPGNSTQYFLFTVGSQSSGNAGFNYYTIDMSASGGLGSIISGPIDLSEEHNQLVWTEKVAAVKGDECETFWVVSLIANEFFAYKISTAGVANTPVRSTVSYTATDPRGYLKLSPDGSRLAVAHMGSFGNPGFLLYDFDDLTGVISNERNLPLTTLGDRPYGVEFSSSSEKLYVHASNDGPANDLNAISHYSTLFQFDVSLPTVSEIIASRTILDSQNMYRGALQLGPDHKIYRSLSTAYSIGQPFLGVIENPNGDGQLANYQHNAISLGGQTSSQGLPPFIASIFSQIELTGDDGNGNISLINDMVFNTCTGDDITVTPEMLTGSVDYKWFLNNNSVPFSTSPNLSIYNVSSTDFGQYKLVVEYTDICGIISTLEGKFSLAIYDIPTAGIGSDISNCDDDNNGTYPFDLSVNDVAILNNQIDSEVLYFNSLSDANKRENRLSIPFESGSTTIYARIQSTRNSNCYDITSFNIELFDSAFPTEPNEMTPLTQCDNNSIGTDTDGFVIFDLTEKEDELLNNQSNTDFTLTYYLDSGYSNQILAPSTFQNTIIYGQTIYTRMTNNSESSCFTDTSFEIIIYQLPTILDTFLFKNCDEDGNPDGFTEYNLDEANEFITLGSTNLSVSYYLSMSDADSGATSINASSFNNSTSNTVYGRIENSNGCHRVSTIALQVSTTSFPSGFMHILESCDDDEIIDGLNIFDLTLASPDIISQFPTGQNLSVSYYLNLSDAQIEQNEISPQNNYLSENPFNQILFVRVESNDNGECFGIGPHLTLTTQPRPEFEVVSTALVCLNLPPITIKPTNPKGNYTYEWKDSDNTIISLESFVSISKGGTYSVIATSSLNCESFPQSFTIDESIIASIDLDDITVTDDSANNSITINNDNNNLGIGDYEYAIDDGSGGFGFFQDEPYFDNVIPGVRTIFINDKNNCGMEEIKVPVIGFPKFFTPNNDGENDTWQIKGVSDGFYSTSLIFVYDRFGKLLVKIDAKGKGWDGLYNGQSIPSTDYWFTAQLIDQNGNIRNRQGHFSLIRR